MDIVKAATQVVGNAGLYFVCFRLSQAGWNVMPTARNARGVDLLAYSSDAKRVATVQVKALSRRSPVPLGNKAPDFIADFVVICRKVDESTPECFVLKGSEIAPLAHRGEKNGRASWWLQPKGYERDCFVEAWHRIGYGIDQ